MSFLEALEAAGADDLTAIDGELVTLQKRLDGLKEARKIITAKVSGKAVRTRPGYTTRNGKPTVRNRILTYLIHAGRSSIKAIADAVGNEPKNMYGPLDHEWFEQVGDAWQLTDEGKAAAK